MSQFNVAWVFRTVALGALIAVVHTAEVFASTVSAVSLGETAVNGASTGVGFANLSITPSASSGIEFVNIVSDLDRNGSTGNDWLVRNFPMPLSSNGFGGNGGGEFSFTYGLGTRAPTGAFTVFSSFTTTPIAAPNTADMSQTAGVNFTNDDIDNLVSVPPGFAGGPANRSRTISSFRAVSSASSAAQSVAPVAPAAGGEIRNDIPGIKQGKNECGPVAAAQSLLWLANDKGLMGLPDQATLIATLKADMGWTAADGVTDANFFTGKQAIAKSLQKANAPNRVVVEKGGTAQGNGTVKFIQGELKAGEDVELKINFSDGTGHWVTVAGASGSGSSQQLFFKDPLTGGAAVDGYGLNGTMLMGYKYAPKGITATIGGAVGESVKMVPLPSSLTMAAIGLAAVGLFIEMQAARAS